MPQDMAISGQTHDGDEPKRQERLSCKATTKRPWSAVNDIVLSCVPWRAPYSTTRLRLTSMPCVETTIG